MNATQRLASYAVNLRYGQIPREVLDRAKACILDILAVSLYGSTKPWSRAVVSFVRASGAKGRSTVLGQKWHANAAQATLANGAMAHAFELDNVRQPGAGVHPGATAFLPAFAMAEEKNADGKAMLTAFVAACEVVSRVGVAAGNSLEKRGFHAPALTGTFAGAAAAGRLLSLSEKQMVHAFGIAGSYSGGLMEFSRCREGAMIKRLHLGKAAEGGVNAAFLASKGFAGPESVLEGKFGFCQAFADAPQLEALTQGLGRDFESMNICIKRFACHINAHAPIEALSKLAKDRRFGADEIEEIKIAGIEKLVTHHAIYAPTDLMTAQYSLPFCVALSLYYDPLDPSSFEERRINDKKIIAMTKRVRLEIDGEIEKKGWDRAARVTVQLKDGRRFSEIVVNFRGTPNNPLSVDELEEKARRLTQNLLAPQKFERLCETVFNLEKVRKASQVSALLSITPSR
ncbi:MAG TPA: MmgE/PrpD family protein [Candidatus Binatia bacterium]|nr:MmgE/PrpD family protein [Candidatus Binatia bacterium]